MVHGDFMIFVRRVLFLSFFVASLCFVSCTKKVSSAESITLVMAEVNPEGTISSRMDKAFQEKVEELSHGKIKIDLQVGGILGDEYNIGEFMKKPKSSIQLERISAFMLASDGCQKSSVLTIPFMFSSREHFWKFANSSYADEILNEPYEKGIGVKGLFFGEEGFRHFFSTKPLSGIADFKGMNLRITPDDVMTGIAKGLLANPVSVNFGDLFMALQTGKADGAEQPIANYLANQFHKVAPYMILDGHTLGVTEVIITSECWDSLSEEQRNILLQAGKYAGEVCKKISQEVEEESKKKLEADGVHFADAGDLSLWKEAAKEIISKHSQAEPKLYESIQNLAY